MKPIKYDNDYAIWDEYELSDTQKSLIDSILPITLTMNKESIRLRKNTIEFIRRELWIIANNKEAEFFRAERLGEDYMFELIVFYKLVLQNAKSTDELLDLLLYYRKGYQEIRTLKAQFYGLEQVDEKWLTKLYKKMVELNLLDFFKLFFEDKMDFWTTIYKANTNAN